MMKQEYLYNHPILSNGWFTFAHTGKLPVNEALQPITLRRSPALYLDHPMQADAVHAMKRYHESQTSGAPAEEIERLRQIAVSQFYAVREYQLRALGCNSRTIH